MSFNDTGTIAEDAEDNKTSAVSTSLQMWIQDQPAGTFRHDGIQWQADLDTDGPLPPVMPLQDIGPEFFLRSLLPESETNWGSDTMDRSPLGFLRAPRRLMNFSFAPGGAGNMPRPSSNWAGPADRLASLCDESALFTGQSADDFFGMESWGERLQLDGNAPRLSGLQGKIPAFLQGGRLSMVKSVQDPFTVIAKVESHPHGDLQGLPVLEWVCQRASRMAGVHTPAHALMVSMNGQSATLLSERFDVPKADSATGDYLFALDGTAIMGVDDKNKYNVSTRGLWKAFSRHLQENDLPSAAEAFFDRFACAWAMADGDLHAKNISMLFRAVSGHGWRGSIAPAYDTVCTKALPGFGEDRQALRIEGKDAGLTPKMWKRFGDFLGVANGDIRASTMSARILDGVTAAATGVPELFDGAYRVAIEALLERTVAVVDQRARRLMDVSDADLRSAALSRVEVVSSPHYQATVPADHPANLSINGVRTSP